jgi:hypothetical protein
MLVIQTNFSLHVYQDVHRQFEIRDQVNLNLIFCSMPSSSQAPRHQDTSLSKPYLRPLSFLNPSITLRTPYLPHPSPSLNFLLLSLPFHLPLFQPSFNIVQSKESLNSFPSSSITSPPSFSPATQTGTSSSRLVTRTP